MSIIADSETKTLWLIAITILRLQTLVSFYEVAYRHEESFKSF